MPLIIGQDNFGELIRQELSFIDKTLFIKEVFDRKEVSVAVIIRPRRFGKTLNLSTLHHFLAEEAYGFKTAGMFDGLKIAKCGDEYMQHQGKYPVVFIIFKVVSYRTLRLIGRYHRIKIFYFCKKVSFLCFFYIFLVVIPNILFPPLKL